MSMQVKLDGYKCERCSHTWIPRSTTEGEPVICPKCKSPYWNRPRQITKEHVAEVARKYRRVES